MRLKLNMALLLVWVPMLVFVYVIGSKDLKQIKTQSDHKALNAVLETASNIRAYYQTEVVDLLDNGDGFVPQQNPAYAVSQVMKTSSESYEYDILFQDAQIERFQAAFWQQQILTQLIKGSKNEMSGQMNDAKGPYVYLAKSIKNKSNVVGMEIVRIYIKDGATEVNKTIQNRMLYLLIMSLLVLLVYNLVIHVLVVKPLQLISLQAQKISKGQGEVEEIVTDASGEMGSMADAFNRLQRSLKAAMNMLS